MTVKKKVATDEERFVKVAGKNWLDPYVHTSRDQADKGIKQK